MLIKRRGHLHRTRIASARPEPLPSVRKNACISSGHVDTHKNLRARELFKCRKKAFSLRGGIDNFWSGYIFVRFTACRCVYNIIESRNRYFTFFARIPLCIHRHCWVRIQGGAIDQSGARTYIHYTFLPVCSSNDLDFRRTVTKVTGRLAEQRCIYATTATLAERIARAWYQRPQPSYRRGSFNGAPKCRYPSWRGGSASSSSGCIYEEARDTVLARKIASRRYCQRKKRRSEIVARRIGLFRCKRRDIIV